MASLRGPFASVAVAPIRLVADQNRRSPTGGAIGRSGDIRTTEVRCGACLRPLERRALGPWLRLYAKRAQLRALVCESLRAGWTSRTQRAATGRLVDASRVSKTYPECSQRSTDPATSANAFSISLGA